MTDDTTPRLSLSFLAAGQAQKEILVNEALQRIDALVQPVAQSAHLSSPPDMPDTGQCWIVASGAIGAWEGYDGAIAQWTIAGWRFAMPAEGWRCGMIDPAGIMIFRAGTWEMDAIRSDGIYISGNKVVGSRMSAIDEPGGGAVIDSQARAVIGELLAVLRTHGLIST